MGLFDRIRFLLENRRHRKYDAGKELDRRGYRLIRCLHRGRFGGAVHLVESKPPSTSPSSSSSSAAERRLLAVKVTEDAAECSHWKRIGEHPHCVRLYEHFTVKGHVHFVCDYARNGDMMGCLEHSGQPLGPHLEAFARRVTRQVLMALDHCHRLGLAHLDFRWPNVLLDDAFDVKLTGFGYMCSKADAQSICLGGDPLYHPPEALTEGVSRHLMDKVDMWQLGAALVHVLLGWYIPILPNVEPTLGEWPDVALAVDVRNEVVHLPARLDVCGLGADVHAFLRALLQYRPEDRLSAAEALDHRWLLGPTSSPFELDEQNNWKTCNN